MCWSTIYVKCNQVGVLDHTKALYEYYCSADARLLFIAFGSIYFASVEFFLHVIQIDYQFPDWGASASLLAWVSCMLCKLLVIYLHVLAQENGISCCLWIHKNPLHVKVAGIYFQNLVSGGIHVTSILRIVMAMLLRLFFTCNQQSLLCASVLLSVLVVIWLCGGKSFYGED